MGAAEAVTILTPPDALVALRTAGVLDRPENEAIRPGEVDWRARCMGG